MDKAHLPPIGSIQRFTRSRPLRKTEYFARSTIMIRWEVVQLAIAEAMKNTSPKMQQCIEGLIVQRDKEIQIARDEYDQLAALLASIDTTWKSHAAAASSTLKILLKKWKHGSRRGLFRLLLLLVIAIIENEHRDSGKYLVSRGLGGLINKRIMVASNGSIQAKPGSLYVAIDDLMSAGLVTGYDRAANTIVSLTQRGKIFIIESMRKIKSYLELMGTTKLFTQLNPEHIDGSKAIINELLGLNTLDVEMTVILQSMLRFPAMIDAIAASPGFMASQDAGIKVLLESWLENLNRGFLDLFILGRFMARPSYGNAIIDDAEEVLGIPTGTLYPKLHELHARELIFEISNEKRLVELYKEIKKKRGPRIKFYDITTRGALYLLSITSLYLADLNVFLKLCQDLMERVVRPVPSPKP